MADGVYAVVAHRGFGDWAVLEGGFADIDTAHAAMVEKMGEQRRLKESRPLDLGPRSDYTQLMLSSIELAAAEVMPDGSLRRTNPVDEQRRSLWV